MIPVEYIEPFFNKIDEVLGKDYKHDDSAIGMASSIFRIDVISVIPSLVQHLCPMESTLKYNDRRKISKVWIGEDIPQELSNFESDEMNVSRRIGNTMCLYDKEKERYVNDVIKKGAKIK